MKKSILIFTSIIVGFLILLLSFSRKAEFKLDEKRYFLESGDSVICELSGFSHKLRSSNGGLISRLEISNDSIYLEGKTSSDKYGELKKGPNKFMVTFDENGIVNTEQLIKFVNREKELFRDCFDTFPTITKVTIK